MRWSLVVLVGVALLVGACGSEDGSVDTPAAVRPPLDDPPDPGPVPTDDGLTDDQRAAIVAQTVRITGFACGRLVEGSGFAVGTDLIATNAHVLVGVETPLVETIDGRMLEAVPVAWDPLDDLAVLRVVAAGFEPFVLGTAADGTVGTVVGWEEGGQPQPSPFRVDRPVTVRIDAVVGDERVERPSWLLAAEIESGDSGAALVDPDGVVIGIAYATTRRDAGVAYAVRASRLQVMLDTADLTSPVPLPKC